MRVSFPSRMKELKKRLTRQYVMKVCGQKLLFNSIPFLPKRYKYLFLAVGYNKKRDTAIVKVEKIDLAPVEVRANMFCWWIEQFYISEVVEVHRKESII